MVIEEGCSSCVVGDQDVEVATPKSTDDRFHLLRSAGNQHAPGDVSEIVKLDADEVGVGPGLHPVALDVVVVPEGISHRSPGAKIGEVIGIDDAGLEARLLRTVSALLSEARTVLGEEADHVEVVKLAEQEAGVELRA